MSAHTLVEQLKTQQPINDMFNVISNIMETQKDAAAQFVKIPDARQNNVNSLYEPMGNTLENVNNLLDSIPQN